MTFSILARDAQTNTTGAAAATGNLCVGGWVLRGDSRAGITASQGLEPSTPWGEDALELMRDGMSARAAVARVTNADSRRARRQLGAIDTAGATDVFTGDENTPHFGALAGEGFVVLGNMLAGAEVLEKLRDGFLKGAGAFSERLLRGLSAAADAGGDTRGLRSAALLVVSDAAAPLTLRVDWSDEPLSALRDLHERARAAEYARWLTRLPTRTHPEGVL